MGISRDQLQEYLTFASELTRAAGQITLKYFKTALEVESKADASPVTIADRETEQFIRREILARYPGHGVLGEEFGASNPGAALQWVVDPIDGTQAFIHGVPLYTVLLALVVDGKSVVGVIHCPPLEETAAAATGLGCTLNGAPCRVSERATLAEARVHTTDYSQLMRQQPQCCTRLLQQAGFCRTWADAYGYLLVATGRAEVMIDPVLNLWDIAALTPVVTEAGGTFTNLDGGMKLDGPGGLATNGKLHKAMLELLAN